MQLQRAKQGPAGRLPGGRWDSKEEALLIIRAGWYQANCIRKPGARPGVSRAQCGHCGDSEE